MRPLRGARVLDLTVGGVGAFSTRHLAELGAEVYRPRIIAADWRPSLRWQLRHRGKRILPCDIDRCLNLYAHGCDLIVADTLDAYSAASDREAPVVRLMHEETAADLLGDQSLPDFALAAVGGLTFITGDPTEAPRTPRDLIATRLAALYAACIACSILVGRMPGAVIDVFVRDAIASCLESTLPIWFVEQRAVPRATNMHDIAWPVAVYKASDGWIGISCGRLEETRKLLSLLGLDGLVDASVSDFTELVKIESLDRQLAARLRGATTKALVDACQAQRIAAATALLPQNLRVDEQALARGFVGLWPDGTPVLKCPITESNHARNEIAPPQLMSRLNRITRRPDHRDRSAPPGHFLEGLRILDLTWALAGPFATMVLGDLGADVVKVESRTRLDSSRLVGPYLGFPDPERSGYFRYFNRNKRSVEFDFGRPKDKEAVAALASRADAVVENLRPGSLDQKGLGYASLRRQQSRIAMCSISGFGRTGPRSNWASYGGAMAEAANGLAMATGGSKPIIPARALADIFAGLYAALGVCAQLYDQRRRDHGTYIEVTQFEAGASALEELLVLNAEAGESHSIVGSDDHGWEAEGRDGRWPVVDAETLAADLEGSGAVQRFETPEGQDVYLRPPASLNAQRLAIKTRSPRLGEHTSQVLNEWMGHM